MMLIPKKIVKTARKTSIIEMCRDCDYSVSKSCTTEEQYGPYGTEIFTDCWNECALMKCRCDDMAIPDWCPLEDARDV